MFCVNLDHVSAELPPLWLCQAQLRLLQVPWLEDCEEEPEVMHIMSNVAENAEMYHLHHTPLPSHLDCAAGKTLLAHQGVHMHCVAKLVILLLFKCGQERLAHAARPVCPLILSPPILPQRLALRALGNFLGRPFALLHTHMSLRVYRDNSMSTITLTLKPNPKC